MKPKIYTILGQAVEEGVQRGYYRACWYLDTYQANYTHWLPANALPMPSND